MAMTQEDIWNQAYLSLLNQHSPEDAKQLADEALAIRNERWNNGVQEKGGPVTSTSLSTEPTSFIGQGLYFERIQNADHDKRVMARIALAISDSPSINPVCFTDLVALKWENFQATVMLLGLRVNTRIRWSHREQYLLQQWACESDTSKQ